MRTLFLPICLALSAVPVWASDGVPPEVPTMVELSNREINRIVCPGAMTDLIFSEEKGLSGHFSGNNAFIKFLAEETDGKREYAKEPSEIYAVCNGSVYTIIAAPAEVNAVTLRLALPKAEQVEENILRFKNMPLEKQVLQLIREGYGGVYPSSYLVKEQHTPVQLCPDIDLILQQSIAIEGLGLRLKSFKASSRLATETTLEEKLFLNAAVGSPILAVAIEQHLLKSGQSTRVFVVERKDAPVGLMPGLESGIEP